MNIQKSIRQRQHFGKYNEEYKLLPLSFLACSILLLPCARREIFSKSTAERNFPFKSSRQRRTQYVCMHIIIYMYASLHIQGVHGLELQMKLDETLADSFMPANCPSPSLSPAPPLQFFLFPFLFLPLPPPLSVIVAV